MTSKSRIAVCAAVLALGLVTPTVGSAATFSVNTTADSTVAGGCTTASTCSLRDALTAAGASADPEDRVEIPAGSYALTLGQLALTGTGLVTIHGAGARSTTINAQGTSRVFAINAANTLLEGVTVTGGVAPLGLMSSPGDGGGILLEGTASNLTLNQVTVSGNTAALNGAGVSVPAESTVQRALTINASTIAGNHVTGGAVEGMGGGVFAFANLSIVNSTISGNSVENPGADQGGGVYAGFNVENPSGTSVTLVNTTIAGNSIAAGAGGGLAIQNPSTGREATPLAVRNTIVAGNTAAGAAADCVAVVIVTSANNLSSDASCPFTDAASKQNANPQLGPLQNNGGPTDTLALQPGSPAIDAGTNSGCPATDQRGVSRPQGSACDIGAFEFQPPPPPPAATPVASADLKLTLKPKPKRPHAGGKLAFKLTILDRGPDAATAVVLNGKVPAATRKIKGGKKIKGKRACKLRRSKHGKPRKFSCKLGAVAVGKPVKLKVLVRPGATPPKLWAKARVASALADPNLKNNKAKAVARLKEPA